MERISRRGALTGALAFVGCACGSEWARAKPARRGCTMSGQAQEDDYYWSRRLMSSGDVRLDQICEDMASKLDEVFGLRPGFCFYNDAEGHNAVADPVARFENRPDGTVLFGVGLLKHEATGSRQRYRPVTRPPPGPAEEPPLWAGLYVAPKSEMSAMMVMAHEWAHIYQYKCRAHPLAYDNVWRMEPHADYLAGWSLARVHAMFKSGTLPPGAASNDIGQDGWMTPTGFSRIANSIFDGKGDSDFTSPDHHGQEEFRFGMFRVGYHDRELNLAKAFARGIEITELQASCYVR